MAYSAQPVGWLAEVIALIRSLAVEPTTPTQFPPDRIYPLLQAAYRRTIKAIFWTGDQKFVVRFPITIDPAVLRYNLPPNVVGGQVLRVGSVDSLGTFSESRRPRGRLASYGAGYMLEGNTIVFDPPVTSADTWYVDYVPSGECSFHTSTIACTDITTTTIKLDATPDEGYFDGRVGGPLGCVVRLLATSGANPSGYDYWPGQERLITGWDGPTRTATFQSALDIDVSALTSTPNVTYDIVPMIGMQLTTAVAWEVIRNLHSVRDKDGPLMKADQRFREEMRDLRQMFSVADARSSGSYGLGPFIVGRF